ncbi:hypothetical protein K1F50_15720 [Muricauda oceani]|uniref:RiboL-PSP-HEPN domain-containing protein n=1 Tax=Flagellimonas oceani TaxID=2698672 RepID=A0A6G7J0K3_9FLAO|nr:hypothetical protein [Allomuricauda oceani]MBW8244257.1 hypothetical protein [Allomuricauda oceani]QII44094.1 hypothetical protein GVT53_05210 [Allomuricauda oceani]
MMNKKDIAPKKVYVKIDNSERYLKVAKELYDKAKHPEQAEIYYAPFVLFCATSVEYLLNDIFIEYSNRYFSGTDQKIYAESFMTLGLRAKLLTFLPIVSGNAYKWDLDSFEYKTLCGMINKRNQIAHGKDFYQGLSTKDDNDGGFTIDVTDLKEKAILLLSKNECNNYFKAFESFITLYSLIENNKLKEGKMVLPIVESKLKTETIQFSTRKT